MEYIKFMKDQENITRIAVLETNQQNLMEKLDSIIERFDKFEEKLDCALEKKADKVVVDRMISIGFWIIGIIGSGIIGYVGLQLIKVIEQL